MKKLLSLCIFYFLITSTFAQVASIRPASANRGQTLTTTISLSNGVMVNSSPPTGATDIYLQQGATIIYTDAFSTAQIYPSPSYPYFTDSMYTDFTIPANAPLGWYDVHVITYQFTFPWISYTPVDNVLANGFLVPAVNSCPVPSGLSATGITNTSATINWTTPTVADTFRIRYKTATSNYFYKDLPGSGGLTSAVLSNLSPGTTYYVDISTICNGAISSTYSVPVLNFTTTTTPVPCIRPYDISANSITNTSANILWTNYVTADTFRIRYAELNTLNYHYINSTAPIPHSQALSNLNPGTTYTLQIASICSGVSSGYSTIFTFTTASTPISCGRPYGLNASSITNTSAIIGWSNFVVADTFRIRYAETGTNNFRYVNVNGALAHNYTFNNLSPATTYDVRISSICSGVSSGYSLLYSFVTTSTPVSCVRPWGLSSSNTANTSITISWSPYVTADTFRIRYTEVGSGVFQYINQNGALGNSVTITNLQANTLYSYQVSSICIGVSSGYSASSFFTTLSIPVACVRPHTVSVTNITNVSALINWTNMVSADTFRIRYNVQGSFNYLYLNQPGASGNSATLTGLYPNTTYVFAISSICSGVSTGYCQSNTFTTSNLPIACAIPTGLTSNNITNNSADVSWTQYVTADTFLIRYSVNGTTNYLWKKIPGTGGNGTTLLGLSPNTTYQWQVRSVCNASPLSSYSAPATFGTLLRMKKPELESSLLKLYPNPATDHVSLKLTSESEEYEDVLSVIDMTGRIIYQENVAVVKGENVFEIDLSMVASGMYLVQIHGKKQILSKD